MAATITETLPAPGMYRSSRDNEMGDFIFETDDAGNLTSFTFDNKKYELWSHNGMSHIRIFYRIFIEEDIEYGHRMCWFFKNELSSEQKVELRERVSKLLTELKFNSDYTVIANNSMPYVTCLPDPSRDKIVKVTNILELCQAMQSVKTCEDRFGSQFGTNPPFVRFFFAWKD